MSTSVPGKVTLVFFPAQPQESEETQWVLWAHNGVSGSLAESFTERV